MPPVDKIEGGPDTIRILLTTDNHVGYLENDPIRGDDSWKTFQEIAVLAREHDVDMVVQGGDLFHVSKPSKSRFSMLFRLFGQTASATDRVNWSFLVILPWRFIQETIPSTTKIPISTWPCLCSPFWETTTTLRERVYCLHWMYFQPRALSTTLDRFRKLTKSRSRLWCFKKEPQNLHCTASTTSETKDYNGS